jgi:hypothetical protein
MRPGLADEPKTSGLQPRLQPDDARLRGRAGDSGLAAVHPFGSRVCVHALKADRSAKKVNLTALRRSESELLHKFILLPRL